MKNLYDDPDSMADVAIVGLGPGGLAAALQAARQDKNVLAFTNRENYTRPQSTILSTKTYHFLEAQHDPQDAESTRLFEKIKFNDEYDFYTAQIKDIERFLYQRLKQYPNVCIVQLKDSLSLFKPSPKMKLTLRILA